MEPYIFQTYFSKYLKDIRKVKDSSISHYFDALKYISNYLSSKGLIKNSIFEISEVSELDTIKEYLKQDVNFIDLNERGHHMYSVGFNHYYKFATGEYFAKLFEKIKVMDEPMAVGEIVDVQTQQWHRSTIIKQQSIESVNYMCEIDSRHKTFTAKSTGRQYMEGHHILPMNTQEKFQYSLDVYANVACLCPICHRLLHYGTPEEKEMPLNKLYVERAERLSSCGICLSKERFKELAG